MKRFGVLWTVVLLSISVQAQIISRSLFTDSVLPAYGKGDLYDLTQSRNLFEVKKVNDTVQVLMVLDSSEKHVTTFNAPNGVFTGYDHGEWGGSLTFTSKSGRTDTIFRGVVQDIFVCYGRVFFTHSLWHLSTHYGQLYMLDTTKGVFTSKIYADFAYPIRRWTVTKDTMYLVTNGMLYRMQYGKAVAITRTPFSSSSMITHGRYIYFGIRGGYARLDLRTKEYRYFVYTGK